jgi:ABC-type glutathione transport system ATPase component
MRASFEEHTLNSVLSGHDASALKADGVQVDVEHLCYSVQVGNKKSEVKNILKDVSFRLRPGSMCALMGPSGSGKRYLL